MSNLTSRPYDVVALGELLIDFVSYTTTTQGNQAFEACPGGAPCNLLACLSKQGKRTAFIGKVGQDQFGYLLRDRIAQAGIDSSYLMFDQHIPTTLAFVHTFADGDRDFSFYRKPGADMMLQADELPTELFAQTKIFHHGTLSMTHPEVRDATVKAIDLAKQAGTLVSFDPNLREPLWDTLDHAKEEIRYGLAHCDILKISDNEVEFLTGIADDYPRAIAQLKQEFNIPLIFVTLGKQGSMCFSGDQAPVMVPGRVVNAVDTTGAGDTFFGAVLNYLVEHNLLDQLRSLDPATQTQILNVANATAALITLRKGALSVMPSPEEVQAMLNA